MYPHPLQSATTLKIYNAKHLQVFHLRITMFYNPDVYNPYNTKQS